MNIYDINVVDAQGNEVSLKEYEGKVLLINNSATECGFTPQYDEMQDIYEAFGNEEFEILDFPCNQFGNQAPGSIDEIVDFCDSKYGITFPIFDKIEVNGDNESPLYTYLKSQKSFEGFDENHQLTPILNQILSSVDPNYAQTSDIKWNFTKFLVDKKGNVVARFEPTTDMEDVKEQIEQLLNA